MPTGNLSGGRPAAQNPRFEWPATAGRLVAATLSSAPWESYRGASRSGSCAAAGTSRGLPSLGTAASRRPPQVEARHVRPGQPKEAPSDPVPVAPRPTVRLGTPRRCRRGGSRQRPGRRHYWSSIAILRQVETGSEQHAVIIASKRRSAIRKGRDKRTLPAFHGGRIRDFSTTCVPRSSAATNEDVIETRLTRRGESPPRRSCRRRR